MMRACSKCTAASLQESIKEQQQAHRLVLNTSFCMVGILWYEHAAKNTAASLQAGIRVQQQTYSLVLNTSVLHGGYSMV